MAVCNLRTLEVYYCSCTLSPCWCYNFC